MFFSFLLVPMSKTKPLVKAMAFDKSKDIVFYYSVCLSPSTFPLGIPSSLNKHATEWDGGSSNIDWFTVGNFTFVTNIKVFVNKTFINEWLSSSILRDVRHFELSLYPQTQYWREWLWNEMVEITVIGKLLGLNIQCVGSGQLPWCSSYKSKL